MSGFRHVLRLSSSRRLMQRGGRGGAVGSPRRHVWRVGLAALLVAVSASAPAQLAQISNLSDIGFGAINSVGADLSQSQTVCVYTSTVPARYSIIGVGSGSGGAFTLRNGAATLAYEVQWNALPNQTSGAMLSSGAALSGQTSPGLTPTCTLGTTPSGSLTVVLRSTALSNASAGAYSGTLSLMISPKLRRWGDVRRAVRRSKGQYATPA